MPILVEKCHGIANEMIIQETNNPLSYLGTPDDQRMCLAFGDIFGPIHIGTGETSSQDRVTNLELIRWRTTLLGAPGQLLKEANKRAAKERKAAAGALGELATRTSTTIAMASNVAREDDSDIAAAEQIPSIRKGKRCSNYNCPDNAHYYAATCKHLWTRCSKDCKRCGVGEGGSMHVCTNVECKAALRTHMS